jgi:hypothetical protein
MDRFKLLVFRGTSPTSAGSCRVGHERRGLDSHVCNDGPCADDARGLCGPSACVCLAWPLSFRLCRRSSSPGKSERKYADGSANSGSTRRLLAGFATCDPMLTLTEASCQLFRLPPVDVMNNFSNRSCFRLPSTAPRIGMFFYPNTNGLIVINLRTFIQQFRFAKSRRCGQAITILYQDAQILANQNAVDKEGVYAHRPRPKRAKSDCPTTGDRGAALTLVRLE